MKFLQCLAVVALLAAGAVLLAAGWQRQRAVVAAPLPASTAPAPTAPAPATATAPGNPIDAYRQLRACRRNTASVAAMDAACPADSGDAAYFDALSRAASAGDDQAQACFVFGDVDIAPLERHAAGAYAATAQRYIDAGIARGDWRFVQLLAASTEVHPRSQRAWRQPLPLPDPFDAFKANRLLRLGARGDAALQVDLRGRDLSASLSAAEIGAAGAWAQDSFDRHFTAAGSFEALPQPCPD